MFRARHTEQAEFICMHMQLSPFLFHISLIPRNGNCFYFKVAGASSPVAGLTSLVFSALRHEGLVQGWLAGPKACKQSL